jgi:hypothetical protein
MISSKRLYCAFQNVHVSGNPSMLDDEGGADIRALCGLEPAWVILEYRRKGKEIG